MILLFLLSLHVLLLLLYAVAIETRRSRHNYKTLIFAACLPFVGELCLLISEFGKTASEFDATHMFRVYQKPSKPSAETEMTVSDNVTREELLAAIEEQPNNLIPILKQSLRSPDMEVAHVAAATIMKLQREHEQRVAQKMAEHEAFPGNMSILEAYVQSVGDYYDAHLLEGEAQTELLRVQRQGLEKLLSVLPGHPAGTRLFIRNLWNSGQRDEALALCRQKRLTCSNFEIWRLNIQLLLQDNQTEEAKKLLAAAQPVSAFWSKENVKEWNRYGRSLGHVEA